MIIFSPISFGNASSHWAVNLNIPMKEITADAFAMMWKMIAIGATLLIVSLISLWIASRKLATPIKQITQVGQATALGNLDQDIEVMREDEVGQLADAFRQTIDSMRAKAHIVEKIAEGDLSVPVPVASDQDALGLSMISMIENLSDTLQQVASHATAVNDASISLESIAGRSEEAITQVATNIDDVAQAAARQAEGLAQATSSMEEMSRSIQQVSRGAQEQARSTDQATTTATQIATLIEEIVDSTEKGTGSSNKAYLAARTGAEIMDETIAGMQQIKTKVNASVKQVLVMKEQSLQIGTIIETIDDITSQTNLLALNAAIEAARAGQHGRGFAVVAEEIRKLADRSANATKDIAGLIEATQSAVAETVQSMEEGETEVESGMERAARSSEALQEILLSVEQMNGQVQLIADAAHNIGAGSKELTNATDAVAAIVEQNTAATVEMAADSAQVTNLINELSLASEVSSTAAQEVSNAVNTVHVQADDASAAAQRLAKMSNSLKEVVDHFKLPDQGSDVVSQIDARPAPADEPRPQQPAPVGRGKDMLQQASATARNLSENAVDNFRKMYRLIRHRAEATDSPASNIEPAGIDADDAQLHAEIAHSDQIDSLQHPNT